MRIATFNVNSLRARLSLVLEWLAQKRPDVLCVQETKVTDEEFPVEAFKGTGYEVIFRGQKKYNGVAILSTSKMSKVSFGLDTEPKDEPRLVRAQVKGVTIVNTYVPQGYERTSDKFEYKLQWFARLREYFERNFKPTRPLRESLKISRQFVRETLGY